MKDTEMVEQCINICKECSYECKSCMADRVKESDIKTGVKLYRECSDACDRFVKNLELFNPTPIVHF